MKTIASLLIAATLVTAVSKRGLDWADGSNPQDMLHFNKTGRVTWAYNWSPTPQDLSKSGLEFIPMQWNGVSIANLSTVIAAAGAREVLLFNEPDSSSQSNISPADAASMWKQYVQPLKQKGIRLGGPAVTNAATGRTWLEQFFAACSGCTVDFLPLHWYGDSIGAFYDYIYSMNGEFALPLWITEFASTSTDDGSVADFLNQTIIFMDTLDFVERYSWFGAFRQDGTNHYAMLDGSGNLNNLGQIYMS